MLKPLLIEIGVEELPAIPLLNELKNIEKKWLKELEDKSLICEFEFFYTPRRLVLWHREFKTKQDDSEIELFGAPLSIAFKDGKPTQAAHGFAKKCNVDISELSTATKGGKEVLYYKKQMKGKPSSELIGQMIKNWLTSLDFGKSMRWGSVEKSFIRPVRWVNVMLGNDLIEMEIFGVSSSKHTYVHRISSFDTKPIDNILDYFDILKKGGVTLCQEQRKTTILKAFEKIANNNKITIDIDDNLLEEVVAITEHPTPLLGHFDKEFLTLPKEVIITSMKEHQRYFPVFKDTELTNGFIVVSNALTDDFSKVIHGNERVLRPRLADALFFYKNDLQRGLSLKGLEKVLFMDGLGSVKDKITREGKVAHELCMLYKDAHDLDEQKIDRAVLLAKADLMSEMVYEFTELQGIMGYYYALALDEDKEVALAIKEQYLPQGESSPLPSTYTSAIVALAIKIDTLLSLFSVNQIPTGSRDPFALRRGVNGIIRIVLKFNMKFDITQIFTSLSNNYASFDLSKLEKFFLERIKQFYKVNPSIIEAVLSTGEREIVSIDKKITAVSQMVAGDDFAQTFSTFKRVANIIKDVDLSQEYKVDSKLFTEEAEHELFAKFNQTKTEKFSGYLQELDALFGLKSYLDRYFEDVMVNTQNIAVKNNRKALITLIYKSFLHIADIKEITV